MQENSHSPRVFAAVIAAVVLVLVTICLSGGTTRESQALVFLVLGFLLLVVPFQGGLGRGFLLAAPGLLLLALTGFMPAGYFEIPAWRTHLQAVGVNMPATLSPQPWLTAQGVALLAAGLIWVAWLVSLPWNAYLRRSAMRFLAYGVVLIAGVALVTWGMGIKIPGWLVLERGFGPFPNRNHTGHVLAIGGVLALGCAFDAMRWNRGRWGFWLFGAAVILAALVVNYSRGGLLLFFGSLGLWAVLSAWQRKSWKVLAVGLSAVLLSIAVVLVKGGETAGRFAGGENSEIGFRFKVWSDTLQLCSGSPWCGVGLENFTSIFPFYRKFSVVEQTVLHPESDWLLIASELGWLGVIGVAAILVLLSRRIFPFASGTQRRLRLAAFSVAVGAALHGLVDVPGHRMGCVLLSTFALVLARRDPRPSSGPSISLSLFSRGLGLVLIGVAAYWVRLPDDVAKAEGFSAEGRYREAYQAANEGLQRLPLNWQLYYIRAKAELVGGKVLAAVGDFRRARILEPHYPRIAFEEGLMWVEVAPGLAIEPWTDALDRAKPDEAQRYYDAMLGTRPKDFSFRSALLDAAQGKAELELQWLRSVSTEEALLRMAEIQQRAEQWSTAFKEAFDKRKMEINKKSNN